MLINYPKRINRLVFIVDADCVLCEVGTEVLYVI